MLLFALNASAKDSGRNTSKKIDINLARMSGTMVYAQVYKMVTEPAKDRKFPDDFPDEGAEITIIGDFEMEEYGDDAYPIIRNARMSNE